MTEEKTNKEETEKKIHREEELVIGDLKLSSTELPLASLCALAEELLERKSINEYLNTLKSKKLEGGSYFG